MDTNNWDHTFWVQCYSGKKKKKNTKPFKINKLWVNVYPGLEGGGGGRILSLVIFVKSYCLLNIKYEEDIFEM